LQRELLIANERIRVLEAQKAVLERDVEGIVWERLSYWNAGSNPRAIVRDAFAALRAAMYAGEVTVAEVRDFLGMDEVEQYLEDMEEDQ